MIMCLLLNNLTSRHKSEVYPYSSETLNIILKIQWVFVFLLSLFDIRNFRGTHSSVGMLKGYMVKERLGTSGETDGGQGGHPPPWPVILKFLGPLSPHC